MKLQVLTDQKIEFLRRLPSIFRSVALTTFQCYLVNSTNSNSGLLLNCIAYLPILTFKSEALTLSVIFIKTYSFAFPALPAALRPPVELCSFTLPAQLLILETPQIHTLTIWPETGSQCFLPLNPRFPTKSMRVTWRAIAAFSPSV